MEDCLELMKKYLFAHRELSSDSKIKDWRHESSTIAVEVKEEAKTSVHTAGMSSLEAASKGCSALE